MLGRAGLKAIIEGGSELIGMLGRRGAVAEAGEAAKGAVKAADKVVNAGSGAVKKAAGEISEKGFGKWFQGTVDKHRFLSYAIAGGVPAYVGWRTAKDDDNRALRAGIFGAGGLYLLSRFRNPKALAKLAESGKNFKAGVTGEWTEVAGETVSHEYRPARVTTRIGPEAGGRAAADKAFDETLKLEGEEAAHAGVEIRETPYAAPIKKGDKAATAEAREAAKKWAGDTAGFGDVDRPRVGESKRTVSVEVDKATGKRHRVERVSPVTSPADETIHDLTKPAGPKKGKGPIPRRHYSKTLGFDKHPVEVHAAEMGRWEGRGEKFGEGLANFGEFLYGGRKWTALHSMAAGALYGAASNDDTTLGGATKGLAIHLGVKGLVHNFRTGKKNFGIIKGLNGLEGEGYTVGTKKGFLNNFVDIVFKRFNYREAKMAHLGKPAYWARVASKEMWGMALRDVPGAFVQSVGDAIKRGTEDEIAEGIAKSDGFFARLTEGYGKNRRAINRMPLIRGAASAGLILGAAGASGDDGEPAGVLDVAKGSAKGIVKGAAVGLAGRAATSLPGAVALFGATLGLQAVGEAGAQLSAWKQSGGPAGRPLNADGDLTLALHKIRHAY
jgi:hypothetical protein